jgi:hypothetical protein
MRTHSTSARAKAGAESDGQAAQQSLSAMRDALGANSSAFWSNQEKALDAMQDYSSTMQHFARSWFERRHEGANAALQASQRMLAAKNPADELLEYQEWLKGAVERTMSDAKALKDELANMAQNAQERREERQGR